MKFTFILFSTFFVSSLMAQQNTMSRSCNINDQIVTAQDLTLCPTNTGTVISTSSSDLGYSYFLRDDSTDDTIAGPMAGTGQSLTFNTGTILGSTTYNIIASSTTTALQFDGIDDIIDCGVPIAFTGDFTLECWVNHTVNTFYPAYISTWTNVPTSGYWLGANTSGQPEFWIGGNYIASTQIISDGNWHHVAAVYFMATGDCELYIDGVLEVAGILPYVGPTVNLNLGNDPTGEVLEGKLDEVRIWSRAKTATEILSDMCLFDKADADLLRYFNFEDGLNSLILSDSSGNNMDGTLINMDVANAWVSGDACGNCEMEMATIVTVNIEDILAPVINNCPADISIAVNNSGCTSLASWNDPTATDNCSIPTVTSTHTIASVFPLGTTTVTYTFDDGNGNTATCSFGVTVTINFSASGTSTAEISGNDGSINLTIIGGANPFTYSWTGPNGYTNTVDEDPSGLEAGTYNVTVTDANGCTSTAQVVVSTQVGLEEMIWNEFLIYPNPTNGIFNIQAGREAFFNFEVTDATGRSIISRRTTNETTSIDLSMLESGVYFVQIKNDSAAKTVRVVLQK